MEKERTYLLVLFDLKNELKKEGIKWDAKKLWYCLKITETLNSMLLLLLMLNTMKRTK